MLLNMCFGFMMFNSSLIELPNAVSSHRDKPKIGRKWLIKQPSFFIYGLKTKRSWFKAELAMGPPPIGRFNDFRLEFSALMAGESASVEHAPAFHGEADMSFAPDGVELPIATYEKLRRLAAEYLRSERADHTLQPTALLHEAFLRVLKRPDHAWNNEAHVIAFAARAMRRILISYGRMRARQKRG